MPLEWKSASVDAHSIANLNIGAPLVTFDGSSAVIGQSVSVNAGAVGTIAIDADSTNHATITYSSLQLSASVLDLTGNAAMVVGAAGSGANITNDTIALYAGYIGGGGALELSAATSITLNSTSYINTQASSGDCTSDGSFANRGSWRAAFAAENSSCSVRVLYFGHATCLLYICKITEQDPE